MAIKIGGDDLLKRFIGSDEIHRVYYRGGEIRPNTVPPTPSPYPYNPTPSFERVVDFVGNNITNYWDDELDTWLDEHGFWGGINDYTSILTQQGLILDSDFIGYMRGNSFKPTDAKCEWSFDFTVDPNTFNRIRMYLLSDPQDGYTGAHTDLTTSLFSQTLSIPYSQEPDKTNSSAVTLASGSYKIKQTLQRNSTTAFITSQLTGPNTNITLTQLYADVVIWDNPEFRIRPGVTLNRFERRNYAIAS